MIVSSLLFRLVISKFDTINEILNQTGRPKIRQSVNYVIYFYNYVIFSNQWILIFALAANSLSEDKSNLSGKTSVTSTLNNLVNGNF